MSSILDDFEDIVSRTDITIHKPEIDKFLRTYCNACLDDDMNIWRHNHLVVILSWCNPAAATYISKEEIEKTFKPIYVTKDDGTAFRYLGYHFKAYTRFQLTSDGFLKPIENPYYDEDCDTIVIKGYPHKELPYYIKFEPHCSSKPLKMVQSNCSYRLDVPGVASENSVSIHREWMLTFR